jgi:transcriptional regulator with XRE-family HTH domain
MPPDPKIVRAAFGVTLEEFRHKKGISQENLAQLSGIDRTYVSGLSRGLHDPSLRMILRLSKALGVRPKDIVASWETHFYASVAEQGDAAKPDC